ncbi:MAG TPA: glycine radical domain-containing protein, partial [Armatimonadota bacterium]|nr:glycine radical domain-containing protein [Armatimonadota bacterium]
HYGMIGSVVSHAVVGQRTSATPNGRRAGESLSDGGSPSQGCNVSGATATLNSLAKPNYRAVPGGAAINLRLTPSDIAGDDGLARLVALLKGYFQMGGEQLQVSVTDPDELRRAMQRPAEHRDLVVRVAGFTAYFVSLPDILQREILARTSAIL